MAGIGSIIEAQQFDRETLEEIFRIAGIMETDYKTYSLERKIMASLFYEPSTRTRFSFESAMLRLGGSVISTENAREFSSKAKGETLEDTVRVVSEYCDVIVLRYHKKGGAERAEKFSTVPIINAGDGTGQHPTQALLDLYTIKKIFGHISGLKIAMVGDLANGRTVRSLAYFLAKHYPDNEIFLISPERVCMGEDILEYLNRYGVKLIQMNDFNGIIPDLDVIYQTRVQKERFKKNKKAYKEVAAESEKLIIDTSKLKLLKPTAIVMHPLPRTLEISYEVDKDPRAKYFEQAKNGLYIRMALLKMILS
jgi:aspartate carbamoyltransferase catalytic subunit